MGTKFDAACHSQAGFLVESTIEDGGILIRLSGDASLGTEHLPALFLNVHNEVQTRRLPTTTVDVRELGFMSSSGMKAFASWLVKLHDIAPETRYRVKFLTNPKVLWQGRSLHALRAFAPELIDLDNSQANG